MCGKWTDTCQRVITFSASPLRLSEFFNPSYSRDCGMCGEASNRIHRAIYLVKRFSICRHTPYQIYLVHSLREGFVKTTMMRRYEDYGRPRGGLVSAIEEVKRAPEKPIDREKTCPLLLRLFYQLGRHHLASDYDRGKTPLNELQIYTWMDATLRELTALITEVNPDTRRRGTYFDFKIVTPDSRGYRLIDIGQTVVGIKGPDDTKTLSQCNFVIGDYLDICITPPNRVIGNPLGRRGRPY